MAGFTANPPTGTANEAVQFTNTTTGDATAFAWDFGDGQTSTERDPAHTFANPGDYTVTLTASGPGGDNTVQQPLTVVAPAQPEPSIVEQTPILPELNAQGVRDRLRAIFNSGTSQGRRAGVFMVVGGDMALQSGYLDPFADPGLDSSASGLQGIIDWYNQVDVGGGRSSFDRNSFASGTGWRASDLLDPNRSDATNCNPGELPIDCEIRLIQPSVAIISVGMNDVGATDPDTFRSEMEQILQTLLNNGVIPVVSTVQPRPDNPDPVRAINEALIQAVRNIEAANGTTIPLYNLWRAYNGLPGSGLEGNNRTPTTAPSGPGVLAPDAVNTYGTNTRNQQILTILDQLRNLVFPDAAP